MIGLALCVVTGCIVWVTSSAAGSHRVGAEKSPKSAVAKSRPAAAGALWVRRYNGPGNSYDGGRALELSPDGSRVYVTGESVGAAGVYDYLTIAFDATSGATLWLKRYHGSAGDSIPAFLAVSPDRSKVFVSGQSAVSAQHSGIVTLAYDASSGTQLWLRRYRGAANANDGPAGMRVSPDSSKVFVAGVSGTADGKYDLLTIAYDAATGGT